MHKINEVQHTNYLNLNKQDSYSVVLVLLFCIFLIPISIQGISFNYIFIAFPLWLIFKNRFIIKTPFLIQISILYYIAIFIIALIIEIFNGDTDSIIRRFASFLVFIAIFSFAFVRITDKTINSFMRAVVFSSIIGSGISIIIFFLNDGNLLGWEQKNIVGSQRYAFVYLMAFYLLYIGNVKFKSSILHISAMCLIMMGIFLSFSRASIISLLICSVYYEFKKKNYPIKNTLSIKKRHIIFILFMALIQLMMPVTFEYYYERIINYLILGESNNYLQFNTSEGVRLGIWERVFTFIINNPLGNGFLGIWSVEEVSGHGLERAASAHNQYIDVFFRTGFIGIVLYGAILCELFKTLRGKYIGLQVAFFSVLIYGIFHETFKESQGAFILSILIGIYSNHKSYNRFV
jgi:O-antigen ligase